MDTFHEIWAERIAERVRCIIISGGRGEWPSCYKEWRRTARNLGFPIRFLRELERGGQYQGTFGAELVDDEIYVRPCVDERLCRWLAHEVCEAILRRELSEPYNFESDGTDMFHYIARLVECGPDEWTE